MSRVYNTYKSLGYSVSKNTLYEYIGYLENNFFITRLENYYRRSYFPKVYLLDNGYMNLFSTESNLGQKLENVIYKKLRTSGKKIGYIDEPYEVDLTDGESNIQVCYELNEGNIDRETRFAHTTGHNIIISRSLPAWSHIENITIQRYDEYLLG